MSFEQDVSNFRNLVERRLKFTVTNAVDNMAEKVIKGTPVDSEYGPNGEHPVWYDPNSVGEARGGWVPSVNGVALKTAGSLDPEGSNTVLDMRRTHNSSYNVRADTSIGFLNRVSYIRFLEFGGYSYETPIKTNTPGRFSFQAPQGMMRIQTNVWAQYVREAASFAKKIR